MLCQYCLVYRLKVCDKLYVIQVCWHQFPTFADFMSVMLHFRNSHNVSKNLNVVILICDLDVNIVIVWGATTTPV